MEHRVLKYEEKSCVCYPSVLQQELHPCIIAEVNEAWINPSDN